MDGVKPSAAPCRWFTERGESGLCNACGWHAEDHRPVTPVEPPEPLPDNARRPFIELSYEEDMNLFTSNQVTMRIRGEQADVAMAMDILRRRWSGDYSMPMPPEDAARMGMDPATTRIDSRVKRGEALVFEVQTPPIAEAELPAWLELAKQHLRGALDKPELPPEPPADASWIRFEKRPLL